MSLDGPAARDDAPGHTREPAATSSLCSDPGEGALRLELALAGADLTWWEWDLATGAIRHDARWSERFGDKPGHATTTAAQLDAITHPQDLARCRAAFAGHANGEQPFYEVEYRLRTCEGEWAWVLTRGRVVLRDASGTPLRVAGLTIDVTSRRKAEEQRRALDAKLQQAQRLESLRALAGRVAHDFNNVLMAVLSNASFCLDNLHSAPDLGRYVGRIERAVGRASDLSRQLLAFAGAPGPLHEEVDLAAIAREVVEARKRALPRRLCVDLVSDSPVLMIEGDADQLRQAIANLLANALEATATSGGEVTVRTGQTACEHTEDGEYDAPRPPDSVCAYVEVSDTGPGMDGATQAAAFDPLFSTKSPGRGLGLAAVLGVARSHGATVALHSEVGVGTTVRLVFRRSQGLLQAPTGLGTGARSGRSRSDQPALLVADDEEHVRAAVAEALARAGFSVLVACDGGEALELLAANCDVVAGALLDMVMPVKTGVDVLAEMRALYPDIPVILSSGYGEAEMRLRLGDLSPNGFLQKPYELALLVEMMRALTSEGSPEAGP